MSKLKSEIAKILKRHELETESDRGQALDDLLALFKDTVRQAKREVLENIKEIRKRSSTYVGRVNDKNGFAGPKYLNA